MTLKRIDPKAVNRLSPEQAEHVVGGWNLTASWWGDCATCTKTCLDIVDSCTKTCQAAIHRNLLSD